MLKELLLYSANSGKDVAHILLTILFIIGVLGAILPIIYKIIFGLDKFKGQPKFERFILFLVAIFVLGVSSSFLGLMLYYKVNTFIARNDVVTSGDKVIEKYYHVESKYNRLEFTLKEPSLYSNVLADNIAVPIHREDEQEYQVEYNNRIYKIDK